MIKAKVINSQTSSLPDYFTMYYYFLCSGSFLCLLYLCVGNTMEPCHCGSPPGFAFSHITFGILNLAIVGVYTLATGKPYASGVPLTLRLGLEHLPAQHGDPSFQSQDTHRTRG